MKSSSSMARPVGGRDTTSRVLISSLLPADSPRLDGEDPEHIQLLAEADTVLQPILVHRRTMRVIDGMHRLRAAVLRKEDSIEAEFFDGSEAEVFVRAVQANIEHGLPLSLRDRKAAAARIAGAYPDWSDRAIAQVAGLSPKTVAAVRHRSSEESPHSNSRVGRDGRTRRLDGSEGRRAARDVLSSSPDVSLRQVARSAGVSISTARKVRQQMERGADPVPSQQRNKHNRHQWPALQSANRPAESADKDKGSPELLSIMQSLMNDPSLKFTQLGRTLLRLLAVHAIRPDDWDRLIDAIPSHRVSVIADLANIHAKTWERFAMELNKRRSAGV